jgi:hypothetical protein
MDNILVCKSPSGINPRLRIWEFIFKGEKWDVSINQSLMLYKITEIMNKTYHNLVELKISDTEGTFLLTMDKWNDKAVRFTLPQVFQDNYISCFPLREITFTPEELVQLVGTERPEYLFLTVESIS